MNSRPDLDFLSGKAYPRLFLTLAFVIPMLWMAMVRFQGMGDGETANDAYYHVAMAEQGHFAADDPLACAAVAAEFAPIREKAPEVLLLACTHFPLFRDAIAQYMGPETALLSVGEETARALAAALRERDMLSDRQEGERRWFTSGPTAEFERLGAGFLGHAIRAEQHMHQELSFT